MNRTTGLLKYTTFRNFPFSRIQIKTYGFNVDLADNKNYASLSLNRYSVYNYNVNVINFRQEQKDRYHRHILQYEHNLELHNRRFQYNSRCGENTSLPKYTLILKFSKIGACIIAGLLGLSIAIAYLNVGLYYLYDIYEHGISNVVKKKVVADSNNKNNFIADVVQKAGPAVVFLEIKGRHPFSGSPITLSNGSGFIVRSNGLILTNAHVVANRSTVSVKLQDGRVLEGQVSAVDPISDLAIVKINANNLPFIPLGNSSTVRPGEWVIAMGSPLSLSNTVTCGIVSSVQRASRELGIRNKDMDYIQTDAVINFGNSGGPLVNLDGQAIGINTMKVTTGISFAIPSDYAIKFLMRVEEHMKNGQKENSFLMRRYLGITMLTLTESVMRDLKNNIKMPNFPDVDGGVFVYKVIPGTPAHIAGILAGDIIIDISGAPIKCATDVYDAVEKSDLLKVTLIRGNVKKVVSIDIKPTV